MYNNWYLLAAIPVFALLILVHEFGHFITAKWAGIRVDEFALGFPPRLLSFKRGETTYSINLIPLGGYVKMPGENGETTDDNGTYDPRNFAAKPASRRLIVLLAGVTMNLILAVVLFSVAEAVGRVEFRPVIGSVEANSPAQAVGLRAGDRILDVNGQPIKYFSDMQNDTTNTMNAYVSAHKGATTVPITLTVQYPGQAVRTLTVNARVKPPQNQGAIGIQADQTNPYHLRTPIWQAPIRGVQDIGSVTVATWQGIQSIIRGIIPFNQAFTGPVGIVHITGEVASTVPTDGWYSILFLTGFLSLNLAIVNVLPIPALDGGRVLLIIIELLRRGKRLSPEREGLVNLIGMAALLLLIALITVNDIGGLFAGR
ncbi:MAG TPA: RIP metalloprotease RseP [Ktedonobacterales bacterium]|nr:RIP metalloprotease RseP [Ktedonobacterales bacterium]